MGLKEEIENKRNDIVVDAYPVSIGEMANIYRDGELDVHPEFQRFFRWDNEQKTRLIESILLGIPIPPIFVAQKQSGRWEVIDGQQRLSTILQFLDLLKDQDDKPIEALVLRGTHFLPSLKSVTWKNNDLFNEEQRIKFKREKLNFTIIKEKSDSDQTKYELFQRLNTGGTHLSSQELRNCLLIMINKSFYMVLEELNSYENFQTCYPTTDAQHDERQDLEMVLRFLIYTKLSNETLIAIDKNRNIDAYITEQMEVFAQDQNFDNSEFQVMFKQLFDLLSEILGEDSFKKYKDGKFGGVVMAAAFEAIVPGVYENFAFWKENKVNLKTKIQEIYVQSEFIYATKRGTRVLDRISQLVPFSRRWFAREN